MWGCDWEKIQELSSCAGITRLRTSAHSERGGLGPLMSKGHGQTLVHAQLEGWWS